eukprot:10499303-Alexandrium_andersonii.AAC.1
MHTAAGSSGEQPHGEDEGTSTDDESVPTASALRRHRRRAHLARWAARNGVGRGEGRAAPSRGDPPAAAQLPEAAEETGGQDPTGPAAVEEP